MQAVCWYGTQDIRVTTTPDPQIINSRDAIVQVTATTICDSDLHLYDGHIPTMKEGDIIGHEFMGTIVEIGKEVKNLRKGDRVVIPSVIACGRCSYCRHNLWSLCDNSNPSARMAEASYGFSPSGTYGYSYLYGGYAGSHAEYIRVPFADIGPVKLPDSVTDEQAVFISEAFPTGYMGAENCHIQPGDTIAIWGCGAVGLFAMRSAYMLGADRVIAIDRFSNRLQMAKDFGHAEVINSLETDVVEELKQITGGRGPDACIDAISMEDHNASILRLYKEEAKQIPSIETDYTDVLQQIIQSCRKGGIVSMIGVHGGYVRQFPLGMAFAKDLTFRMGQMHAHRYTHILVEHVALAEINPAQIITHHMDLHDTPQAYEIFKHQSDECLRIVLKP